MKGFNPVGRGCSACGALATGPTPTCEACGSPARELRLGDALVERVLGTGGEVEFVDEESGLARLGGVAARLRYPVGARS